MILHIILLITFHLYMTLCVNNSRVSKSPQVHQTLQVFRIKTFLSSLQLHPSTTQGELHTPLFLLNHESDPLEPQSEVLLTTAMMFLVPQCEELKPSATISSRTKTYFFNLCIYNVLSSVPCMYTSFESSSLFISTVCSWNSINRVFRF